MTSANNPQSPDSASANEVYAEAMSLCKKRVTAMLATMIAGSEQYHNWDLKADEAPRLCGQIQHKQRIICSSFVFQMNRFFSDFRQVEAGSEAEKSKPETP